MTFDRDEFLRRLRHGAAAALTLVLAACGNGGESGKAGDTAAQDSQAEAAQTETERLMAHFEQAFQEDLQRSPMMQSYLGMKDDYGEWDEIGEVRAQKDYEIAQERLAELRAFDFDALEPRAQLSYRLAETLLKREIDGYEWRQHSYPVNQMFGWQQQIPSFLINIHRVTSVEDAEAYVERLEGVDDLVDEIVTSMKQREEKGVMPPAFVYPLIIEASRNVITGAPYDDSGRDSALMADFEQKVAALDISEEERKRLVAAAHEALVDTVGPAYEKLIGEMKRQAGIATDEHGVWKLPDGEDFYNFQLSQYTTTDLTADEIHQIGLDNVERIHQEMRAIMDEVGYEGSLQDFFAFMRTDEQFYYENTEEGRQRYLSEAKALIDTMREELPAYFGIRPEADMVVKRVEEFREKSAGKAFYQAPALDGSRPGTYYANLYRMEDMPTYQMEALAYHEGIPGHHMQIAIAQELEDVPQFQKLARFTAYTEGWGLYSEYLPKEMGFYEDPYSDFGRLAMELWRACRLVVDTGLHAKKWTRQEAIDYLVENTPNPEGDAVKAIERYIVMPGQATAYMIGKERILALREAARQELGSVFDIKGFHDEVLKDGPVPLSVLEEKVQDWVDRVKAAG